MPISIDRSAVEAMLADGAQLVEVLPTKEYDAEHLPGADESDLTIAMSRGWKVGALCGAKCHSG